MYYSRTSGHVGLRNHGRGSPNQAARAEPEGLIGAPKTMILNPTCPEVRGYHSYRFGESPTGPFWTHLFIVINGHFIVIFPFSTSFLINIVVLC